MNLLSRLIATATVAATVTLAGCSTSQKIQVVQPGDNNLSCAGLKEEMAKLDKAQAEIEGKKGLTGTNVASAFSGCQAWPTPSMTQAKPSASSATAAAH